MFWYVLPICKGSLTSLLYIDSCWVYLVLRSLTSLLYVIHVCRGSLTSPLMHCILCFMWVRILLSLFHVMHVCRGTNFTSLFINVYCTYIFIVCFVVHPFVDDLTKRGRRILRVYIWMFVFLAYAYMFCLCKMGRRIWVYACLSPFVCIHVCLIQDLSLYIYLFIAMHELRGSFYEA